MPATKRRRSSTFAARCCSAAACRRSMSASRPTRRCPKAGRRTGASGSIMTRRSSGTTSSAASRASIRSCSAIPVVRREDGSWLYLLPSVIDDVDLGITHVVRGEDHVSNSAAQIQMFEALGASAAAVRARGAAGRGGGQVVEAARLLWRRASARRRRRADGAAVGAGADRHVAAGRADRRAWTSWRDGFDFSRTSAARPPISTRTRSSWSTPGCCTSSTSRPSPTGCPQARPRRTGCCSAPISSGSAISHGWFAVLHGEIEPPELSHDERLLVQDAAAIAERPRLDAEPWRDADRRTQGSDGQEGPRAVPPAPPRADRPRKRARKWPASSRAWARSAPIRRLEAAAKR